MTKRIGFGLDAKGFFPVLYDSETPIKRMASEPSVDVAMQQGLAWGERDNLPVDVVRVDTRLLEPRGGA